MNQLYRKVEGCLFFVGILLLFAGFSQVNAAENILGDWVFTMTMPDNGMGMGAREFTINSKITKDEKGNYAMTWDQQMTPPEGGGDFGGPGGGFPAPQVKVENIKLDGDKLTFVQKVSFGDMGGMGDGQEMVSNFAGTVKGDVIDGKLTTADNGMGMGPMEFTLKGQRKAAEKPAEAVTAAPKAGLEGDWVFKMSMADSGMGPMSFTVNSKITKDAEGKYSMTWNQVMDQPEGGEGAGAGFGGGGAMTFNVKVENIKLDGNKLTFTRKVDMGDMGGMGQGGEMVSDFTGTFEGDKISGKVVGDYGEMTLTGTRKAPVKATPEAASETAKGLAGDWEFVTTFGDMGMELRANVTFKKDADGKYTCTWKGVPMEGMGAPGGGAGAMPQPEITISDIKLDGDKLTFVQKVDLSAMQMGEMTSNYSGTLKGDKIEGAFTSDMGESKSIGTRKKAAETPAAAPAASASGDPLVGDWQFTMSFGGGDMGMDNMEFIINSTFTKKEDGTYSGTWVRQMPEGGQQGFGGGGGFGGGEPPVVTLKDIKLDGNKLTFVQSVNFGDQEMSSNFSGTIENGKITGSMSNEMMGDMPITGTKKK